MKKAPLFFILCCMFCISHAEDGYRLWLRYDRISDSNLLQQYRNEISFLHFTDSSATLQAAKGELLNGLQGLLDKKILLQNNITDGTVFAGTTHNTIIHSVITNDEFNKISKEGFVIKTTFINQNKVIVIAANTDIGVLYGCFHFLRLLQTHENIQSLSIASAPLIQLRMLDHWYNLNRTVERGYAGISIWNWQTLPTYIDKRYIDYARANASIGINAVALNNVNANALILTKDY